MHLATGHVTGYSCSRHSRVAVLDKQYRLSLVGNWLSWDSGTRNYAAIVLDLIRPAGLELLIGNNDNDHQNVNLDRNSSNRVRHFSGPEILMPGGLRPPVQLMAADIS